MKARIKKTGEIVNIAEYAKIPLDICDPWGDTIELRPDEVELIQEPTKDEHWQDVRERAAIAAMQGIMNFFGSIDYNDTSDKVIVEHADALIIAKLAVEQADALIKELKRNEL